ncbi:MAG: spore cortex-lytic enzyme [Clostridia bacterium]|nr:spore cortex-lytic enzyme [Clostridia bacterium]MBR3144892.1 spore cortex-lytic enzyme [Clostridia bacterium]
MKNYAKIIIITILCVCTLVLSVHAVSKIGSVGNEVTEIQKRLFSLGYYTGKIDGIFGSKTRNAVVAFQKAKGLVPDGIVGKKTLSALGLSNTGNNTGFSSSDTELLAKIISGEARGESYLGQVAVGAVVLNRVVHPSFPDTVAGVIFQHGAFTAVSDGQFYNEPTASAYKAASAALSGIDPTSGAIYYYNPKTATNKWIRSRPVITTIGKHVFCA